MVNMFHVFLLMAVILPAVATYLTVDDDTDLVGEELPPRQHYDVQTYSEPLDEEFTDSLDEYGEDMEYDFDAQMKAECIAIGLDC